MAITMKDLDRWINEVIRDDKNFQTKDLNPEAEKAKSAVLRVIRKMKGRIDWVLWESLYKPLGGEKHSAMSDKVVVGGGYTIKGHN